MAPSSLKLSGPLLVHKRSCRTTRRDLADLIIPLVVDMEDGQDRRGSDEDMLAPQDGQKMHELGIWCEVPAHVCAPASAVHSTAPSPSCVAIPLPNQRRRRLLLSPLEGRGSHLREHRRSDTPSARRHCPDTLTLLCLCYMGSNCCPFIRTLERTQLEEAEWYHC